MTKFKCYKSFNETITYSNENGDEVVVSNLWRFATLEFLTSEIPSPDSEGNYLNIDLPNEYEYSDIYVNHVDIFVSDEDLREEIENYEDEDLEDFLEEKGFSDVEVQYDLIANGEESIKIITS